MLDIKINFQDMAFFLNFIFFVDLEHAFRLIDFFVLENCVVCWNNPCPRALLLIVIESGTSCPPKGNRFPVCCLQRYFC